MATTKEKSDSARKVRTQYTALGRSGLQVSRLALGTMNFGFVTDETTSFEILDEALEAGINFVDTADVYGGPQRPDIEKGYGISEEIIGRWLAQGVYLPPSAYEVCFLSAAHGTADVDKLLDVLATGDEG